ncbi:MAG: hydantoinase B/oxoprolinase family protein, partial [Fidelibacterota bacterium]
GISGIHTHMTNTMNTPVEVLEIDYPVMILKYRIRRDSGGRGRYRGGDGIEKEFNFLDNMQVTVLSDRRKFSPYGLWGGSNGKPGRNLIIKDDGRVLEMGSKFSCFCEEGDVLLILTPGGGGYGKD